MAAAVRLRLRGPNGKQHTCSLLAEATLLELRKEAATAFDLGDGNALEVLFGVPPKLCEAAGDAALSGLVRSGDTVVIRQTAAAVEAAAAAAAAASVVDVAPVAAALPSQQAPSASGPWACAACTLVNVAGALRCEACDTPNPNPVARPQPSASTGGASANAQLVAMPDDNSCLFHGVAYLLDSKTAPNALRQIVAKEVRDNPTKWDEATLGKPRSDYIDFISDPKRWGGQVEIAIFAAAYRAEIAVVEVQSGRCDVYGEGAGYTRRVYLLHSGIHFDAVTIGHAKQREVPIAEAANADAAVKRLASERKSAGGYVDQATMRLRCKICGYIANGDYEARAHAGEMNHKEFAPA